MRRIFAGAGFAVFLTVLASCAQLPSLEGRSVTTAFDDTQETRLGRAIQPMANNHPGKSGVVPLTRGGDAFAARALMTQAAQRSIDIQNYIWHDDMAGILLFNALVEAADKGVRVRLLLDDNNTDGLDGVLAALDSHDNIEVRLFNPFLYRNWRWVGYLTDFSRLNRRMHNKSFTVDNQATIVGGRNIGDEYFGASDEFLFIDLDALAVGPVVKDVSSDFDRYWASASAYPVGLILERADDDGLARLHDNAQQVARDPKAAGYVKAMNELSIVTQLLDGSIELEWAVTRMVSDDPSKGLGTADTNEMLPERLGRI
ncbi:MAG TPA: phospholipase D-like domain-containing protein, partial [Pusillimonas sp.]|uniref:phospholipase D-like domain-containing protein n=1 Tax=Pusillimonas sp. TaxID=3040095 RepID=UPI002CD4E0DF